MSQLTIFGTGNIGSAVAALAIAGGSSVQFIAQDTAKTQAAASKVGATASALGDAITGDIVVLAVPYPSVASIVAAYADQFAGKTIVETTNPLDFTTGDALVVPADSSATAELQKALPASHVLKAFNTNFAATLATKTVGSVPTTVLVAGDDSAAKQQLIDVITAGGIQALDAGSLKRARELEALGFLQLTFGMSEKISWMNGFALVK